MAARVSRRSFLAAGGVLIVGLGLDGLGRAGAQSIPDADRFLGKSLAPDAVDSFLAVHRDGSVTIFVGRVDLGTGGRIAMRQLVGEELDVPLERIAMIEGDTALTPNQGGTGGQLRHRPRRVPAPPGGRDRAPGARGPGRPAPGPAGRRSRGGRRRGPWQGRQRVGELWRADRRSRVQPEGGRRGPVEAPRSLPVHRQVAAPSRPAREDHRAPSLSARSGAPEHAPRPRHPPARVRRHARLGGRVVDRGHRWARAWCASRASSRWWPSASGMRCARRAR